MDGIALRDDCDGVDWEALKRDLAEDDFDNGRTPDELERSFRASARVVFAWAPLAGQHVALFTDDAPGFYAACGFAPRGQCFERVVGRWLGRFDPR